MKFLNNNLPDSKALLQFRRQRASAKSRGVAWELTFEDWWRIWQESGHYSDRGRGAGKYVMARRGDCGPYAIGNVFICTFEQNFLDGLVNTPVKRGGDRRLGKGRGWSFDASCTRNPYCASFRGKKLGRFPTAGLAEAAYQAAVQAVAKK